MDSEADKMKRSWAQSAGSTSVDLLALADCVEQFPSKTVVVLGDFVADEFQFGEISRVSRCLLYTSPSPRDLSTSRMPSSA